MNILDLFESSSKILEKNGILTSKLDVKILLSFLLKIDSKNLLLHFKDEVSSEFYEDFKILLQQRLNREPIANIIGKKSFWDFDFYVNKNVLTPRNDSEILIEAVIENYKNFDDKLNILDLGTGSGCLILTLLKIYKNSTGMAVDISNKALDIAQENAKNLNIKNITFLNSNWNDKITEKFDIIVSNPPYIPRNEIEKLDPEVNAFNPLISLDGGNDGLDCYRYLSSNLGKNLKDNSKIFLEIGMGQENDIKNIFKKNNFILKKIYKDLAGINRILYFQQN